LEVLLYRSVNAVDQENLEKENRGYENLAEFYSDVVFGFRDDVQGAFAKMSRKWPKTAENRLKSTKMGLFIPKIT